MSIDNQDIKQLINILQKMLNDNSDDQDSDQKIEDIKPPAKIKNKSRDKKVAGEHFNKFVDMPEKNMHKEDTAIDKKLNRTAPTPRSRPFNFIDVRCRICGKTESVNPVLVESPSRYKCNNCATSSG